VSSFGQTVHPDSDKMSHVNSSGEGVEKPNSLMRQRFYDGSYRGHSSQDNLMHRTPAQSNVMMSTINSSPNLANDAPSHDGVPITNPDAQVLEQV